MLSGIEDKCRRFADALTFSTIRPGAERKQLAARAERPIYLVMAPLLAEDRSAVHFCRRAKAHGNRRASCRQINSLVNARGWSMPDRPRIHQRRNTQKKSQRRVCLLTGKKNFTNIRARCFLTVCTRVETKRPASGGTFDYLPFLVENKIHHPPKFH